MVDMVKVGELVMDFGILPRGVVNSAHVDNLKNAALAGATFPPIIAERSTKRVVDGAHRHKVCVLLYGEEYEVEVDFRDYANDNDMWMAAVEANANHGLAYTAYDRRRVLVERQSGAASAGK